jgi:redox-sensitive bicupin YhaK (pirin superfamily)
MNAFIIKRIKPIGLHFETMDPFLFCAHHLDQYPKGNAVLGPDISLGGRPLGNDFQLKDGFRMYHGQSVPGFPEHPHRGFETVTVVLKGFVDHSDSFGAAGRYGAGDVQWMTAGSGMQHAEMFPLLNTQTTNPCELFQIWLNLPAAKKMVTPHYKMLWRNEIPVVSMLDAKGNEIRVTVIAGKFNDTTAVPPAPDSWAAKPDHEVDIFLIELKPNAQWTLPAASAGLNRMLYFYEGTSIAVGSDVVMAEHALEISSEVAVPMKNGSSVSRLLLLQGRPIGEPVVQYGPFVMNTQQEIQKAFSDYHQTLFGGWPWDRTDPVHPRDKLRFAGYSDGNEEFPDQD